MSRDRDPATSSMNRDVHAHDQPAAGCRPAELSTVGTHTGEVPTNPAQDLSGLTRAVEAPIERIGLLVGEID